MGIDPRRIKHATRTNNNTILKLQHLRESTGWSQKGRKVKPDSEETRTLLYLTLWKEALVYNGGHVCETLLLSAAIRAPARCQISGGITNGVNYNIF